MYNGKYMCLRTGKENKLHKLRGGAGVKTYEKYKRMIKWSFVAIMLVVLVAAYGHIWIEYYNGMMLERPYFRKGNWAVIALYGIVLFLAMRIYGGFRIGVLKRGNLIYSQVLSLIFANIFTYGEIAVIDRHFLSAVPLVAMTGVQIVFVVIWTLAFQTFYEWIFPPKKLLLISGDRSEKQLVKKLHSRKDKYIIQEVIDYREMDEQLFDHIGQCDAVMIGDIPSEQRNHLMKECFARSIRTYSVPKISDILIRSSVELNLFDSLLLLSRNIDLTVEQQWMKRAVDVVISGIAAIITLPLFAVIAIGIKLTDGGPVFYTQTRMTKDGKHFQIYKFRTMIQNAEKLSGARLASEHDPRILPIGRVLRATRLDELPQIYNILKGEMSVVGPRPERPELAAEIMKEIPEFSYRLKVKAGLTGYAQIYGKYNTTFYDKLKLDLTYIRNYSLLLDLKLILMTPKILLMKESTEGVIEENHNGEKN